MSSMCIIILIQCWLDIWKEKNGKKNLNLENNIFHVSKWLRLTKTKSKSKHLKAVWKLFRTVEDSLLNQTKKLRLNYSSPVSEKGRLGFAICVNDNSLSNYWSRCCSAISCFLPTLEMHIYQTPWATVATVATSRTLYQPLIQTLCLMSLIKCILCVPVIMDQSWCSNLESNLC